MPYIASSSFLSLLLLCAGRNVSSSRSGRARMQARPLTKNLRRSFDSRRQASHVLWRNCRFNQRVNGNITQCSSLPARLTHCCAAERERSLGRTLKAEFQYHFLLLVQYCQLQPTFRHSVTHSPSSYSSSSSYSHGRLSSKETTDSPGPVRPAQPILTFRSRMIEMKTCFWGWPETVETISGARNSPNPGACMNCREPLPDVTS